MNSKVRVLHVIDRLTGGGAEESLAVLLEHADLDNRAHHLAIALISSHGVGGPSRPTVGEVLSLDRSPSLRPGDVRDLRRAVRDFNPHVIHSSLFRSSLATSLSRGSTPQLVTLTSTEYAAHASDLRLKQRVGLGVSHRVHGWLLKRHRVHVHAVSEAVSTAAQQEFGLHPDKVAVIPRGRADVRNRTRRPRDEVRQELGLTQDQVAVAMVAREHRVKNHVGFLEAIADAVRVRPEVRAVLAGGPGNASADMTDAIERLQLSDYVLRLGHREDVPDLLAAVDVLACTSHSEGMPGGVIEGLAAGLPVIAYDAPGVDEAVGRAHPGLVPFNDRSAFVGRLVRLCDPALRAAWQVGARTRYEQEFTLDTYVHRMTDLYLELATSPM
jgi:glycosyltransferase involved in cell wall biosynthesis